MQVAPSCYTNGCIFVLQSIFKLFRMEKLLKFNRQMKPSCWIAMQHHFTNNLWNIRVPKLWSINVLFTFACNTKHFALPLFSFFFFSLLFWDWLPKVINVWFTQCYQKQMLPVQCKDTLNEVCVSNVLQYVICSASDLCHAVCFSLFMVTSIHSVRKSTKNRNLRQNGKWHRKFKSV